MKIKDFYKEIDKIDSYTGLKEEILTAKLRDMCKEKFKVGDYIIEYETEDQDSLEIEGTLEELNKVKSSVNYDTICHKKIVAELNGWYITQTINEETGKLNEGRSFLLEDHYSFIRYVINPDMVQMILLDDPGLVERNIKNEHLKNTLLSDYNDSLSLRGKQAKLKVGDIVYLNCDDYTANVPSCEEYIVKEKERTYFTLTPTKNKNMIQRILSKSDSRETDRWLVSPFARSFEEIPASFYDPNTLKKIKKPKITTTKKQQLQKKKTTKKKTKKIEIIY